MVASALANAEVHGAELGAVVRRQPDTTSGWPQMDLTEALGHCDIVVECAGQAALTDYGPEVIAASKTLVITSAGALADLSLALRLDGGPGRWVCTSGAIGGLDILAAARRCGAFKSVTLTTTKLPCALQQTWMTEDEIEKLLGISEPRELFHGGAQEAGRRFPTSLNVASALALATGCSSVDVRLRADPEATRTRHEIRATHALGDYRFTIVNAPSATRPSTSAVTAHAVTRTLQLLVDPATRVL